jgi:hypothetical protein
MPGVTSDVAEKVPIGGSRHNLIAGRLKVPGIAADFL